MIKTVLIDDEPLARSIVKEYLNGHPNIEVVQECNDGFEGVKAIMQHKPDLIFLDIQMPKINGFEMLELLENNIPPVIFTTAFDEYAIKAFEAHAVDYLLKPFSKERFDKAIQKWLANQHTTVAENTTQELIANITQHEEKKRVVVRYGNNIRIIPTQDIHYIEAFDDYVKIFTVDDCFLKKKTMAYFEELFDVTEFVRVHRSYILQLKYITRIEPYEKNGYVALLKNGKKIPLSRTGYSKLKHVLGV